MGEDTTMQAHRTLTAGDPDAMRAMIASHPFCAGLDADHVTAMADGASEHAYAVGDLIIRHGHDATALYLLVEGDVALEISEPAAEPLTVETLHAGDPLGWSWLYPPRSWAFDARCLTPARLLRLDGAHLRGLVEQDAAFGRDLTLRVGSVVVERLQHARAQIVDIRHHDHR